MERCGRCGQLNRSEAQFCAGCGEVLVSKTLPDGWRYCPTCGRFNPPAAVFCAACGTRLYREEPRPPKTKSRWRTVLFIVIAGVFIALLVLVGVPLGIALLVSRPASPATTPRPTTPRPIITTPTPLPTLQTWEVAYTDDFSSPESGWISVNNSRIQYGQENGEYHFYLKEPAACVVWNKDAGQFGDMVLEVDTRVDNGDDNTAYGLVFRLKDTNNHYRFSIFSDGSYVVGKMVNGGWIPIQPRTKTNLFNKGNAANYLKVVCNGTRITVSANEHNLITVSDNSFSNGYMGMFVGSRGPDNYVIFDNIKVYKMMTSDMP